MRFKIQLISKDKISLPRGYNQFIQALIYNHLNEKEAQWLHEKGFEYEKRSFKLFCFSDILEKGQYNKERKTMTYPREISFFVTSPVDWILQQIAQNILTSETVCLGSNECNVQSIEVMAAGDCKDDKIKLKTLSPIETHSTFMKEDGKKKTHHYTPFEEDFSQLVEKNLQKKWRSFYNEECPHSFFIQPLFRDNRNERIRFFGTGKGSTVIKGWHGLFKAEGHPDMIRFALDAGLGSRNSQGFGCVEVAG